MTIRVVVNGAHGRMGQEACQAIKDTHDLLLVKETGRNDDLAAIIRENQVEVVVDLTVPNVVFDNAKTIINNGARPVIGTTGLKSEEISELQRLCHEKKLGGIIAPNFSIAAVLMMKYAKDAAQYLPNVEIIELHHDKKVDAPSGTAIKTAEMIAANRCRIPAALTEKPILPGARGAIQNDIHIHSVRLPGLVAHQMVIFGGYHESLTLTHDSMSRLSFMPGILLCCRKVVELATLVYGLEHLLAHPFADT